MPWWCCAASTEPAFPQDHARRRHPPMDLNQRASGVLLHVTSLPGPHGIGDFGPDAYRFVDWLAGAGQRLWQWLPTTPIGPGNSPYQSVSAFAGSPLMVALEPLVEKGWLRLDAVPDFGPGRVDFGRVVPWRMDRLREAHAGFLAHALAPDRAALAAWAQAQAGWLDDYTLFMALETAHAAEIGFWAWVQWCFDPQAAALKAYANAREVHLMGDLPIFIAQHSADCWARPDLYFLDEDHQPTVVAGVPPDVFSEFGQRWGNPLYRWDRMAAEDFSWWTARIRRAMDQADVFRIDHFRGFAGYYENPARCPTAIEGTWQPGPGIALFQAIERALGPLPIVAEDLGLVTPDVVELLEASRFPRLKIVQFAFGGDGAHEFLPHNYDPNTVVYTGTHDNHRGMVRAAANSVSRLAIYPLQDVLGLGAEHRMNLPGSLGEHNWSWRFSWDMVGPEPGRVLGLITAASGRGPFGLLPLPA